MKMRYIKITSILVLVTFLVLGQNIFAQEKTINIECNLTISETNWTKDSQLKAAVTIKNNSDKEVEIRLPPRFILVKQGKKIYGSENVIGDQYSAKEKDKDHIIIKKTRNTTSYKIRQFFEFSLKSGETKTVEFDVSKLAWNASMSSILVDSDWYNKIPSGNYDLYYSWGYDLEEDKNPRRINIISNGIPIKLNSEK